MSNLIGYAQTLVHTVVALMPSRYQRKSLEATLGLLLDANGQASTRQSAGVSEWIEPLSQSA